MANLSNCIDPLLHAFHGAAAQRLNIFSSDVCRLFRAAVSHYVAIPGGGPQAQLDAAVVPMWCSLCRCGAMVRGRDEI